MSTGALSRRLILVMLGATMAAIMMVLVAMVPEKADAAGRFKIVKKTFSNTGQIAIPPSGSSVAVPYPSGIAVRGLKRGKIRDVNLTLKGFTHTHPADVDVMVSHKGVTRTVMSDVGSGTDVSNLTFKLDDETANFLPDTSQLSSGTFLPTNNTITDTFPAPAPVPSGRSELAGFDGKRPNGPWTLWVVDDFATADGGQFAGGWSITIKARVLR